MLCDRAEQTEGNRTVDPDDEHPLHAGQVAERSGTEHRGSQGQRAQAGQKTGHAGVKWSPFCTAARLVDRMVGSAAVMLYPSPMARIVIVAARPVTCSCSAIRRC